MKLFTFFPDTQEMYEYICEVQGECVKQIESDFSEILEDGSKLEWYYLDINKPPMSAIMFDKHGEPTGHYAVISDGIT